LKQRTSIVIIVGILVFAIVVGLVGIDLLSKNQTNNLQPGAYVGVDVGYGDENDVYRVADAVHGYANLIIIGSLNVTTDTPKLTRVCNYLYQKGFSFIIYVGFSKEGYYPPQGPDQKFFNTTTKQWGNKFLGAYIFDEPGGKQLDYPQTNTDKPVNRTDISYSQAAQEFVHILNGALTNYTGPNYYDTPNLRIYTSDYGLYWFDYLFGYNVVFGEFIGNQSSQQKQLTVALCRGAANSQNKEWGAIITFSSCAPNETCLENGTELYKDMTMAWQNGAKYILVFDSPGANGTVTTPLIILEQQHLDAMKKFWNYAISNPQSEIQTTKIAYVLPQDYGFGFRKPDDTIWGLWPADSLSPTIWNDSNNLISKNGMNLDIVYESLSNDLPVRLMYNKLIFWNGTIIGDP
jgi:hypothetical protein